MALPVGFNDIGASDGRQSGFKVEDRIQQEKLMSCCAQGYNFYCHSRSNILGQESDWSGGPCGMDKVQNALEISLYAA